MKIQTDVQRTISTTTNHGKVTTSRTSMLTRGLVGSLLLGPAGMIVGASTAKKKQGKSTSKAEAIESTKYSLIIFIRIEDPVVFASSYDQTIVENIRIQVQDFIKSST